MLFQQVAEVEDDGVIGRGCTAPTCSDRPLVCAYFSRPGWQKISGASRSLSLFRFMKDGCGFATCSEVAGLRDNQSLCPRIEMASIWLNPSGPKSRTHLAGDGSSSAAQPLWPRLLGVANLPFIHNEDDRGDLVTEGIRPPRTFVEWVLQLLEERFQWQGKEEDAPISGADLYPELKSNSRTIEGNAATSFRPIDELSPRHAISLPAVNDR
jgi:hypothetical protein